MATLMSNRFNIYLPKDLVAAQTKDWKTGTEVSISLKHGLSFYTVTAYGNSGNGTTSLSLEVTSGGICVTSSQDRNYIITYIPREPNMTTVASVVSSSCKG